MIKSNRVASLEFLLFTDICSHTKSVPVLDLFQEAKDYEGPRKEFFTDVLREVEDKYFLNGVKHYLKNDYYNAGTILGAVSSEELTLVRVI